MTKKLAEGRDLLRGGRVYQRTNHSARPSRRPTYQGEPPNLTYSLAWRDLCRRSNSLAHRFSLKISQLITANPVNEVSKVVSGGAGEADGRATSSWRLSSSAAHEPVNSSRKNI